MISHARVIDSLRPLLVVLLLIFFAALCPGEDSQPAIELVWKSPWKMSRGAPTGIPVLDQQRLYVVASGIRAYDRKTGALSWQAPVHLHEPWKLLVADGAVLVVEASVYALDAGTGKLRWEYHPTEDGSLARATVEDGTLFFGAGHKLYAVRISDGTNLWKTDIAPKAKYTAAIRGVSVGRGTVYVSAECWRSPTGGRSSGWLVALDLATGRPQWRFVAGRGNERRGFSSTPVLAGDLILLSDYFSNSLLAVDRHTHRQRWQFRGEEGFVGFPEGPLVVGSNVYAASGDTNAYALDLGTGRLLWKRHLPGSNDAYALCGRNLLVNHQGIAVLDPRNGEIIQTILDTQNEYASSDFVTANNYVYVSGPKGVYGLQCH